MNQYPEFEQVIVEITFYPNKETRPMGWGKEVLKINVVFMPERSICFLFNKRSNRKIEKRWMIYISILLKIPIMISYKKKLSINHIDVIKNMYVV